MRVDARDESRITVQGMTRAALVSGFQAQTYPAPDLINKSIPFRGALARLPLPSPCGCAWMSSGSGIKSMQSKSQHWIWMTLAVLALSTISYFAMPRNVIEQATALLSWG
jgi:hypothetical protein